MALARAHDLLTQSVWEGANLKEILEETLEPYLDRTVLAGPPVALTPNAALALSMVFHELGTNATKYGALSNDAGHVEISWALEYQGGDTAPDLVWKWIERGGPTVVQPTRRGFGTVLLERVLAKPRQSLYRAKPPAIAP